MAEFYVALLLQFASRDKSLVVSVPFFLILSGDIVMTGTSANVLNILSRGREGDLGFP